MKYNIFIFSISTMKYFNLTLRYEKTYFLLSNILLTKYKTSDLRQQSLAYSIVTQQMFQLKISSDSSKIISNNF